MTVGGLAFLVAVLMPALFGGLLLFLVGVTPLLAVGLGMLAAQGADSPESRRAWAVARTKAGANACT
jgi:hypothetical protein